MLFLMDWLSYMITVMAILQLEANIGLDCSKFISRYLQFFVFTQRTAKKSIIRLDKPPSPSPQAPPSHNPQK